MHLKNTVEVQCAAVQTGEETQSEIETPLASSSDNSNEGEIYIYSYW